MARLKKLKGRTSWDVHILDEGGEIIGRKEGVASIVLDDTNNAVSKRHAKLERVGNQWFIVDVSRNGTSLNGRRLVKEKKYPLTRDSLIQICNFFLTFSDSDAGSEQRPKPGPAITGEDSSEISVVIPQSHSHAEQGEANSPDKLAAVMQLTRELRKHLTLEEMLETALDYVLSVFPKALYGVALLTDENGEPRLAPVIRFQSDRHVEQPKISTATYEIIEKRVAGLSADNLSIGASLVDSDDKSLGAIMLHCPATTSGFKPSDLDLLAILALQLSILLENRILQEATLRARVLERELRIANEVQIGLLPAESPQVPGYEFFDYYSPAKQIGGDYYDYIQLGDRYLAIALGDVAGKGIPAALHMARVASALNVFLVMGLTPAEALRQLNLRLGQRNPQLRFVTMILGLLDYTTHEILLASAGHMAPLVLHADGSLTEIEFAKGGLPLGIMQDAEYGEQRVAIAAGDTLILYSDGITDARNLAMTMYGNERFFDVVRQSCGGAPSVGQAIMDDIHTFVGEAEQADDISLVCVSRTAVGVPPHDND